MKLEYMYEKNNNIKKSLKINIIMSLLVIIIGIIIEKDLKFSFFIIIWCLWFNIILIFFYLILYFYNRLKQRRNQLFIEKGEKKTAYVISTETLTYRSISHHYLVIDMNYEKYKIGPLKKNRAFILLEKYLKQYENLLINSNNILRSLPEKISINVYKYNHKIYADLKSINFNKILSELENSK